MPSVSSRRRPVGILLAILVALLAPLAPGRADTLSVADFGARCNGAADDTAAIASGVAAVLARGGGTLRFPSGDCRISRTLTVPGLVLLEGSGAGRLSQPAVPAATRLSWHGAASTMIDFGAQATVTVGGGIKGMRLDGRGRAARALRIKDHQHGRFDDLLLTGATTHALEFTNTPGRDPTGFCTFTNLQIALRGGATNNANGIHIDGRGEGFDGVTLCTFLDTRIEHANGAGIKIGARGDAFNWGRLFVWRADTETGVGVWAYSREPLQVIAGHQFDQLVSTSGMRIEKPGAALGWKIKVLNDVDINKGIGALITGEGASDVEVLSSYTDGRLGAARRLNYQWTVTQDPMFFQSWDRNTNLLHTGAKTYRTGGNSAAATIADAGLPGGATEITTGGTAGDAIYVHDTPSLGRTGITASQLPQMIALWMPLYAEGAKARVGLLADVQDPPRDGVYVEADPARGGAFHVVSARDGARTITAVGAVGIASPRVQWRIELDPSSARVFYRTPGNDLWGLAAVHTTNIPSAPLAGTFYVKTDSAGAKTIRVYDYRASFMVEMR